jgi:hypothetical protein
MILPPAFSMATVTSQKPLVSKAIDTLSPSRVTFGFCTKSNTSSRLTLNSPVSAAGAVEQGQRTARTKGTARTCFLIACSRFPGSSPLLTAHFFTA